MLPAELISITLFGVFIVAGVVVPLPGPRRLKAIGIGVAGILIAGFLPLLEALPGGSVMRDFVPGFFLLVAYWQTGQFVVDTSPRFQGFLEGFDERWFPAVTEVSARFRQNRTVEHYLEVAYLACYPLVPLGVAVLYLLGRSEMVDQFWIVVLAATYATHGLTAVFHSAPPWMTEIGDDASVRGTNLGSVNEWIIQNASIRANTFPSGHVSSSFAIGFVLLDALPLVGVAFLWVAVSLAISTVLLRYHYVLDVLLGIGLAGVVYLVLG